MFEAYRDRKEAGQHLGQELLHKLPALLQQQQQQHATRDTAAHTVDLTQVVVLGLVRGGMPVADAVARALRCPCDAFVVRKVGAPMQPEFGIGAVAEGGHVIVNEAAVESVGASQQELQHIVDDETQELQRRVRVYRGGQPHLPVQGKTVVLVDDGLATGVTARAACVAMRAGGASVVVLAVPVGSQHTVAELREQGVADVVVCLRTPHRFRAVGAHYLDFSQTTDEEVVAILSRHQHPNIIPAEPLASHDAAATAAAAAAAEGSSTLAAAPIGLHTSAAGKPAAAAAGGTGKGGAAVHLTDTGGVKDQAHAARQQPTAAAARASTLASALGPHPKGPPPPPPPAAAAAAAAAAAPPPAGLRVVSDEQIVIADSETGVQLHGCLTVPPRARGLVVFAHGSGSSRNSPRNRQVAATLNRAGLATLLFDLLSPDEAQQRHNVFDIPLLANRLQLAVEWLEGEGAPVAGRCPLDFPLGFFGASTGGAAALWAAAYLGSRVSAVVVRGGRPDLAAAKLPAVTAPTLLLVGGEDTHVLELNNVALQMMGPSDSSKIVLVPGAGHLFEGPGQLEMVAEQAVEWFTSHIAAEGDE